MKTIFFEFSFTGTDGTTATGDGTAECEVFNMDVIHAFKQDIRNRLIAKGASAAGHVAITYHIVFDEEPAAQQNAGRADQARPAPQKGDFR